MSNMKKWRVCGATICILLAMMLSVGCANNQDNGSVVSYCAKEETDENRIYFNYPQLQDDVDDADEINALIVDFVKFTLQDLQAGDGFAGNLWDSYERYDWNNNDYTSCAIDMDYEVMRNDANYLSVVFEGLCNYKFAAHPTDRFFAVTIDRRSNVVVGIDDLYRVEDDFIKAFQSDDHIRAGFAKKFSTPLEGFSDTFIEDVWGFSGIGDLENFLSPDEGYRTPFFLTEEAVGISVTMPFAMGDHFEVLVDCDELQPFEK